MNPWILTEHWPGRHYKTTSSFSYSGIGVIGHADLMGIEEAITEDAAVHILEVIVVIAHGAVSAQVEHIGLH